MTYAQDAAAVGAAADAEITALKTQLAAAQADDAADDAEIARLKAELAKLTTPTEPVEPPAPSLVLTVNAQTEGELTLSWNQPVTESGRDGTDATGYPAWSGPETSEARSRRFDKLRPDTVYNLHVVHNGAKVSVPARTKAATVAPPVEPPPTTGARTVPFVGKSKLPWNSVVFGHGTNPAGFESWRNRPVDGVLTFATRYTWSDLEWLPSRRPGDLLVWSIPPFPENIGGSNAKVAAGEYNAQIRAVAAKMLAAGWNTNLTVIRLGWENNGNWYQWGQDRGGQAVFIAAFRKFVEQFRAAGLTKVLWSWNLNKGPQSYNSGVNWTTGYPGDDVVDVVGLDAYDMWPAMKTDAEWNAGILRRNPGLDEVAEFCRARKKQMALEEWGVCHGANGGYDNPFYVRKMFEWLNANKDIIAYENTYDHDGAPASLNHKLSDGGNPKAAAQYRLPFPNGWGG